MIMFVIMQRSQEKWQELEDPDSVISSIIAFFNIFLKTGDDNRIIVISNRIIFDSQSEDLEDFIKNLEHEEDTCLSTNISYVMCLINAFKCESRILLISFDADKRIMRCIFGIEKMGIRVDAISFGENEMVKQGAIITGGLYLNNESLNKFFLKILGSIEEASPISFQTICYCHKRPILYGLVCPICLAVYCKVLPLCKKCKIKFQFNKIKNI